MGQASPDKLPLDEVMMAMDVVDTLRHRELLIDRELRSDGRDQTLMKRLRELYASQGIEVPDHILAEGVEALKEDRFTYRPAESGLQLALARTYVQRGKWFRRLGILFAAVLLAWASYYFLVTAPDKRNIDQLIGNIETEITSQGTNLEAMQGELQRLQNRLEQTAETNYGLYTAPAHQLTEQAQQSIDEAQMQIGSALALDLSVELDQDSYQGSATLVRDRLGQQADHISKARVAIEEADKATGLLNGLRELPDKIDIQRDAITQISKDEEAGRQASSLYEIAQAALRTGAIAGVQSAYQALTDLHQTLAQSYRLRIVSSEDEYSGVWRIPELNPDAKNYYLIVEAIDDKGLPLTLSIENEEDGQFYQVSRWGIRVAEPVFSRVAKDKQDDGILQQRDVGVKRSGYLHPEYSIKTAGATITSW